MTMRPVRPITPVVGYLGGKRKLAPKILPFIDSAPHITYVEPFMGMGGLFFSRKSKPNVEVINDINHEVVTFFRVLQRFYPEFLGVMRYQITSRANFDRLADQNPENLLDFERAARFLYLQACSFGGRALHNSFGLAKEHFHGFNLNRLEPLLDAAHDRLSDVVIECLNYSNIITRWDAPETLFYVDPPYVGGEKDYGKGVFSPDDFKRLGDQLMAIEGRFVFSINDASIIRDIFAGCRFTVIPVTYTISKGANTKTNELIITGPPDKNASWDIKNVQDDLF